MKRLAFLLPFSLAGCQFFATKPSPSPPEGRRLGAMTHQEWGRFEEISRKVQAIENGLPLEELETRLGLLAVPFDEVGDGNPRLGTRVYHFASFGVVVYYQRRSDQLFVDKLLSPEIYLDGLTRDQRREQLTKPFGDYLREKAKTREAGG